MKLPYAVHKTREYIDRDLEAMFDAVRADNGGKIPGLAAGVRERCYELDRCRKMIEPGTVRARMRDGGYRRL